MLDPERASGREGEEARLPEARRPAGRLRSADPHSRAVETPRPRSPDFRARAGFKARRKKGRALARTPPAAAVEDLKTRHEAAAPRRAPRLLTPHVPALKPRLLAPHAPPQTPPPHNTSPAPKPRLPEPRVPPQATPPRPTSHASPSRGPRPAGPSPPRPSPPRCPLPRIRARRPAARRPCAVRRRLRGPVSAARRWMQLAPEAGPALPRRPSRLLGLPGSPAAVLPPSPPGSLVSDASAVWSSGRPEARRRRLSPASVSGRAAGRRRLPPIGAPRVAERGFPRSPQTPRADTGRGAPAGLRAAGGVAGRGGPGGRVEPPSCT